MPLLQFFVSPNQFTQDEKLELVSVITEFYARYMPDFFVNIIFHEIPHGNFFMGGKSTDGKFVRFMADHIAVNWNKDASLEKHYLDWIGGVFKDRFEQKGWTWEFHVIESDKDLWRVQSLIPPLVGAKEMEIWQKAGKGVPWQGVEA